MNSLLLSCHGFFTTVSGKLPQNYFWQSRPLQNIQNSPTVHRVMNRPMNRWIEALSHLRHYLRFRLCLSHYQHEHNFRIRAVSPSFPPWTCYRCCFRYSLNCFPVSELTWRSSLESMFGSLFHWAAHFWPGGRTPHMKGVGMLVV